jgi:hypothetical protein
VRGIGCGQLRSLALGLAFLRTVYPVEADTLKVSVVQDSRTETIQSYGMEVSNG